MKQVIIYVTLILSSITSASAQWVQKGVLGEGVTTFTVIGKTLFAGTDRYGIYRSTDNGDRWWDVSIDGINMRMVTSLTSNNKSLFAVKQGLLYESTDKGDSWTKLDSTIRSIPMKTIMVTDTMLFAGSVNQGVYRSLDMGKSWSPVNTGLGNLSIQSLMTIGDKIYAGTSQGLFSSTNNGNDWISAGGSLIGKDITYLTGKGTTIFAGTQNSGLYRSIDNGNTWILLSSLPQELITSLGFNKKYVLAGTSDNLYMSSNNGDTWSKANPSSSNGHTSSIYMNDSIIVSSNKGVVFLSAGDSILWKSAKDTIGLVYPFVTRILVSGNGNLFAGTYGDGLLKSTDNGEKWFTVNIGNGIDSIWSLEKMGETLFAGPVNVGSSIMRSTDGGEHWESVNKGLSTKSVYTLKVVGTTLFTSIDSIGIYRSTDKGDTWQLLDSVFRGAYVYEFATLGSQLYATTFFKGIYRSTDSGDTWKQVISSIDAELANTICVHGTTIFAGLFSKGILRSTDNGVTWSLLTGVETSGYCFGEYKDRIFYGCSNGVFQSSDNGDTWIFLGIDNGAVCGFAVNGSTLFAGSLSGGIWKRDVSTLSADGNESVEKNLTGLYLYPNPVTNTLTIDRTSLQFPENTQVHYTLSTIVGGKVMEFDNSEAKFTVSLEGMASGVYLLTAGNGANRAAVMVTVVE